MSLGFLANAPLPFLPEAKSTQVSWYFHLAELMLFLRAKVTEKLQLLQSKGTVHLPIFLSDTNVHLFFTKMRVQPISE